MWGWASLWLPVVPAAHWVEPGWTSLPPSALLSRQAPRSPISRPSTLPALDRKCGGTSWRMASWRPRQVSTGRGRLSCGLVLSLTLPTFWSSRQKWCHWEGRGLRCSRVCRLLCPGTRPPDPGARLGLGHASHPLWVQGEGASQVGPAAASPLHVLWLVHPLSTAAPALLAGPGPGLAWPCSGQLGSRFCLDLVRELRPSSGRITGGTCRLRERQPLDFCSSAGHSRACFISRMPVAICPAEASPCRGP